MHDKMRGHLFENMVVMEFVKHAFNEGRSGNLSFYRDSNGNEIGGTFGLNNDSKSQLKSGETVEMKHGFSLGEPSLANFAKIKFVKP